MKLRGLYILIVAVVLIASASCKDEVVYSPCSCDTSSTVAGPYYKGCDFTSDCGEAYDCSIKEMLSQIYRTLEYPTEARDSSIQGLVLVRFDVDILGSPYNFRAQSDTLGYGLPEAAIVAAMSLGDRGFYPQTKNCEPIVSEFMLPIKFKP